MTLNEFLSSRGYAPVPMRKTTVGHFEIEVQINNNEARFLIDTGASNTVVDQKSANRFSLPLGKSEETAGGLGTNTQTVSTCVIDMFEIGPLQFNKFKGSVIRVVAK